MAELYLICAVHATFIFYNCVFVCCFLLSPHADKSFTVSFFVSLFVRKLFCSRYLPRGLTQGDETWQDGRSGWVAGHLPFW